MQVRVVVTFIEHINLRELALNLRTAELENDMEKFRAHLREKGSMTRKVSMEEVMPLRGREAAYYELSIDRTPDLHEKAIKRTLSPVLQATFRDREFKKGGRRSSLLRQAKAAR